MRIFALYPREEGRSFRTLRIVSVRDGESHVEAKIEVTSGASTRAFLPRGVVLRRLRLPLGVLPGALSAWAPERPVEEAAS